MHAQNRYTKVNYVHIHSSNIQCNGTAAAFINSAQLADLPENIGLIHNADNLGHRFGTGIVGAGFAARTGIFCQYRAFVDEAAVAFFIYGSKARIVGTVNIGGKCSSIAQQLADVGTLSCCQILQIVQHEIGIQAGVAVGTDFLFISQNRNSSVVRCFGINFRSQCGISTNLVILAVGTNQTAVQAYVLRLGSRNKFNFRTHKIMLGNTVHFVEQCQRIQLYGILNAIFFAFVNKRQAADNNIQLLALNAFAQLALVLFSAKMRQQIGYTEYGVAGIFAHAYLHQLTVLFDDNAMHSQRHGYPLIFADTAVIMRFEISHLMVFVYRVRFQIQTRRIDMRSVQAHACLQRCGTEGGHSQRFATVYEINLVARFICLAFFEGNIACSSQLFYSFGGKFALCFCCIQKFLVAFAVCKRCFLGSSVLLSDMGEFPCQILLQFLCSCHNLSLLVSTLVSGAKRHYVNNTTNGTIWGEEGKCIQSELPQALFIPLPTAIASQRH